MLEDLLETERAIVRAYDAALEVAADSSLQGRLQSLRDRHRAHVRELREAMGNGGYVEPDASHDVAQTAGAIRSVNNVERLIESLRVDEADLAQAYERSLESEELPSSARGLIGELLEEERGHEAALGELLGGGDAGVARSGPGDTGRRA